MLCALIATSASQRARCGAAFRHHAPDDVANVSTNQRAKVRGAKGANRLHAGPGRIEIDDRSTGELSHCNLQLRLLRLVLRRIAAT
jgi:hypothetical protein